MESFTSIYKTRYSHLLERKDKDIDKRGFRTKYNNLKRKCHEVDNQNYNFYPKEMK